MLGWVGLDIPTEQREKEGAEGNQLDGWVTWEHLMSSDSVARLCLVLGAGNDRDEPPASALGTHRVVPSVPSMFG